MYIHTHLHVCVYVYVCVYAGGWNRIRNDASGLGASPVRGEEIMTAWQL